MAETTHLDTLVINALTTEQFKAATKNPNQIYLTTDDVLEVATQTKDGLLSAADKKRLDGIADNANNYTLPSAGAALGGVKTGGDVTISAGIITVNDDSHNHIISNIDGLSTSLDGKYVKPANGIPKTDLASSVQSSLNKADTAIQSLAGYATEAQLGDKVDKVNGKGLSTNDLTNALKTNYDAAYTHSTSTHAPTNAERNTIIGIQKNGTDLTINATTRKVNITVPTNNNELTNGAGYQTSTQVNSAISVHNSNNSAHSDIRTLITELTNRLNTLADSDDTTLDQMSEIVAYIKSNKDLIDGITTSKINVSDIVNVLTSTAVNKPLSAAQGKVLKDQLDALVIPTKTSQLANDSGFITASEVPQTVLPSNTAPKMDGTAAVGTENAFARGDHIHPKDTSKVDKIDGKQLSTEDFTTAYKTKLDGIGNASTSKAGLVQLSSAINSTSTTLAATPSAVKQAYDLALKKQDPITVDSIPTANSPNLISSGAVATALLDKSNTGHTHPAYINQNAYGKFQIFTGQFQSDLKTAKTPTDTLNLYFSSDFVYELISGPGDEYSEQISIKYPLPTPYSLGSVKANDKTSLMTGAVGVDKDGFLWAEAAAPTPVLGDDGILRFTASTIQTIDEVTY